MTYGLKQVAITATVIITMVANAHADNQYDKCMEGAETNFDFGKCGDAWIDREDAKLNATWKQLHGPATGQTKKDLLAEQRLWIAFKESACKCYANGEWGREGETIHASACLATITADRTQELEGYLEGISQQ